VSELRTRPLTPRQLPIPEQRSVALEWPYAGHVLVSGAPYPLGRKTVVLSACVLAHPPFRVHPTRTGREPAASFTLHAQWATSVAVQLLSFSNQWFVFLRAAQAVAPFAWQASPDPRRSSPRRCHGAFLHHRLDSRLRSSSRAATSRPVLPAVDAPQLPNHWADMAQKTFPNQVLCPALCGRNRVSPCRTRGNRADFDTLCGTVGNPVLAHHPCRGARATKKTDRPEAAVVALRTGQKLQTSRPAGWIPQKRCWKVVRRLVPPRAGEHISSDRQAQDPKRLSLTPLSIRRCAVQGPHFALCRVQFLDWSVLIMD